MAWLGAEGTVGKEPTQMECPSEEFGFYPDGNGEPQKDGKQKSVPSKSVCYHEHPAYVDDDLRGGEAAVGDLTYYTTNAY